MIGWSVVLLVRHGRTPLNATGELRGRIDVALDEIGQLQVAAVGRVLAVHDIGAILTSPLLRARQTAAAISTATGAPVEIDERFTDRDYGPWAGHPQAEVEERYGSLDAAPGVEPAAAVRSRAVAAMETAADRGDKQPVVVVAHDAVNRIVLAALVPALGPAERIPQRTGCWNRLERTQSGWTAPIIDAMELPA